MTEWTRPSISERKAQSFNIWGEEKTGKSTLALSFPEPLYIINADRPMEHLLEKLGDKEYYYIDFIPPEIREQQVKIAGPVAQYVCDQFETMCKKAIKADKGTLVWDGASRIWGVYTEAYVGKDRDVMPREYQKVNSVMEDLLDTLVFSGLNLVMTNQTRDVWTSATKKLENVYKPGGFGRNGFWVTTVLQTGKKKANNTTIHTVRFDKDGYDTRLEGLELENPTYEKITALHFPKVDPKLRDKLWLEMTIGDLE